MARRLHTAISELPQHYTRTERRRQRAELLRQQAEPTISYTPEQQEQKQMIQARLQDFEARKRQLLIDRERARQGGHTKDVHEINIQLNSINAGIRQAQELDKITDTNILTDKGKINQLISQAEREKRSEQVQSRYYRKVAKKVITQRYETLSPSMQKRFAPLIIAKALKEKGIEIRTESDGDVRVVVKTEKGGFINVPLSQFPRVFPKQAEELKELGAISYTTVKKEPKYYSGTTEAILQQYTYPVETWEQRTASKILTGISAVTSPFTSTWSDTPLGKFFAKEETKETMKGGWETFKTISGYNAVKDIYEKQKDFLLTSEYGKSDFNVPIGFGAVKGFTVKQLDEALQTDIKTLDTYKQEVASQVEKEQFADRSQKIFETMYFERILSGELEGEKAVEMYKETPEFAELTKQYQAEVNARIGWKKSLMGMGLKGAEWLVPSTKGEAILRAEQIGLVGGAIKVGVPMLAKGGKAVTYSWKGLSAYILLKEAPKIRDVTLPKEERALATVFSTLAVGNLLGGTYVSRMAKKPFQYLRSKFSRRYIPYDRTYTKVIESTTKPITNKQYREGIKKIRALTKGKRTTGVSATYSKLQNKIVEPQFSGAGAYRQQKELYDLYLAGVIDETGKMKFVVKRSVFDRLLGGKPLTRLWKAMKLEKPFSSVLLKPTEIRTATLKRLYGGYIGIGDMTYSSKEAVWGSTSGRGYFFRGFELGKVPKNAPKDVKALARYLREYYSTGRKIYPSAETYLGESVEQQLNIASRFGKAEGVTMIKTSKGYYSPLQDKWTYYQIQQSVPKFVPKAWTSTQTLGGIEKSVFKSKVLQRLWSAVTTEWRPIKFGELTTIKYSTAVARGVVQPKAKLTFREPASDMYERAWLQAGKKKTRLDLFGYSDINVKDAVKVKKLVRQLTSSQGILYVSSTGALVKSSVSSALIPRSYPSYSLSKPSYPSRSSVSSVSSISKISSPSYPSYVSYGSYSSLSEPSYTSYPSYSEPSAPSYMSPSAMTQELYKFLKKFPKKRWKKGFAYAPSFTEKIAGIKPIKIDVIDAEKLLKKELTGFELTPAVKFK